MSRLFSGVFTRSSFRTRFAGFSKDDAQATCAALKKLSLECVVMRAD